MMSSPKHCDDSQHSPLLTRFVNELSVCADLGPLLDLACGNGRNGLYLSRQGLPVVFADHNEHALVLLKNQLPSSTTKSLARIWPVNLENPGLNPLSNQTFGAVLVFRYLHRPLFDAIQQAIAPGGMIIYQTFTLEQAKLGRPKNPNFLLKPGELASVFDGWEILHHFEGIENGTEIASIVAIKPL